MRIICDYCLTEYQVEPPPKTDESPSRFSFRCSNCGRVFSAEHQEAAAQASTTSSEQAAHPAAEATTETPSPADVKDILIKQGDQTYSAENMSIVQRWIVERRLNRSGSISHDGLTWKPLNDVAELQAFLEIVEQVQSLESPIQNPAYPAAEQPAKIQKESSFVDVAELEATIDFEPENTADEMDKDPFPTEEVPLPSTPIVSNLRDMEIPNFAAPPTEETPFDYPAIDEATLEAPKIELPPEPNLPSLANAQDMIEAPGPSFAEDAHPDFPTEEELTLFEDDEPSQPVDNEPLFSDVEADWDDDFEDELAWVSDKKKTRRIALGLILLVLCVFTGKIISEKMGDSKKNASADNPSAEEASAAISTDPINSVAKEEKPAATQEVAPENKTVEEGKKAQSTKKQPKIKVTSTPIPKKKKDAPKASKSDARNLQKRASETARKEQAKRGPKAKTAADHMDRGRQAIKQGKYNEARIHYLEAVEMEPSNPEAINGLAFAAHGQDDLSFARVKYCEALKLSKPSSALAKNIRNQLSKIKAECN